MACFWLSWNIFPDILWWVWIHGRMLGHPGQQLFYKILCRLFGRRWLYWRRFTQERRRIYRVLRDWCWRIVLVGLWGSHRSRIDTCHTMRDKHQIMIEWWLQVAWVVVLRMHTGKVSENRHLLKQRRDLCWLRLTRPGYYRMLYRRLGIWNSVSLDNIIQVRRGLSDIGRPWVGQWWVGLLFWDHHHIFIRRKRCLMVDIGIDFLIDNSRMWWVWRFVLGLGQHLRVA
jgi:hypothetical protein